MILKATIFGREYVELSYDGRVGFVYFADGRKLCPLDLRPLGRPIIVNTHLEEGRRRIPEGANAFCPCLERLDRGSRSIFQFYEIRIH